MKVVRITLLAALIGGCSTPCSQDGGVERHRQYLIDKLAKKKSVIAQFKYLGYPQSFLRASDHSLPLKAKQIRRPLTQLEAAHDAFVKTCLQAKEATK